MERARASVARGSEVLEQLLGRIEQEIRDGATYDDKMGSHYAWMLQKHAQVMESQRKVDAHYHQWAKHADPEDRDAVVVQYLRELPPARRAAIRALLEELDGNERALLS